MLEARVGTPCIVRVCVYAGELLILTGCLTPTVPGSHIDCPSSVGSFKESKCQDTRFIMQIDMGGS